MGTLRGYARLLRLPLFVTAVADAVAGYLVASFAAGEPVVAREIGLIACISTGLYLFGMVQNNLADVRRDRLLGVKQPLVTGEVSRAGAWLMLVLTVLLAGIASVLLGGAGAFLALGAFAVINLYNLGAKRGPAYVAMTVMGLVRLLNFGIGVTAAVGIPRGTIDFGLLAPSGPMWMKHGMAIFATTWVLTGYSIAARSGARVSSRPWQFFFAAAMVGGLAILAYGEMLDAETFHPPVARLFAALLLAELWPGHLWTGGATGGKREPAEYGPFVERGLYWLIALDAAFVADTLLIID